MSYASLVILLQLLAPFGTMMKVSVFDQSLETGNSSAKPSQQFEQAFRSVFGFAVNLVYFRTIQLITADEKFTTGLFEQLKVAEELVEFLGRRLCYKATLCSKWLSLLLSFDN